MKQFINDAKSNIKPRLQTFIVEICTLIMGVYVFCHLNYLDDPRVTPFPPPHDWRELMGFTDDWWFATLLVLISVITIIGIVIHKNLIIEYGLMLTSSIYMLIAVEFTIRGLFSAHFNITWIICIGFEALLLTINYKGGGSA